MSLLESSIRPLDQHETSYRQTEDDILLYMDEEAKFRQRVARPRLSRMKRLRLKQKIKPFLFACHGETFGNVRKAKGLRRFVLKFMSQIPYEFLRDVSKGLTWNFFAHSVLYSGLIFFINERKKTFSIQFLIQIL